MQGWRQLRTLSAGLGNSNNMDNRCGRKLSAKGRPDLKPQGITHSKRAAQNIDEIPKNLKYAQGIFHNGLLRIMLL